MANRTGSPERYRDNVSLHHGQGRGERSNFPPGFSATDLFRLAAPDGRILHGVGGDLLGNPGS
jgi:hypothetical protein